MIVDFSLSVWDAVELAYSTDFPRMAHSAGIDPICKAFAESDSNEEVVE